MSDVVGQLLGAVVSVAGVALGVVLGARYSGRAQRDVIRMNHVAAQREQHIQAYTDWIARVRRYRVFIMTQEPHVTVIEDPELQPDGFVAFVDGGEGFMDAMQDAAARVKILVGGRSTVWRSGIAMHDAMWQLARSRAEHPTGHLPPKLALAARKAEDAFVEAVQQDLARFDLQA